MLGNYVARYHSAKGVDDRIRALLTDKVELTYSEDLALLDSKVLRDYDLVISYLEFRPPVPDDAQTDALLSFVSGGGGFLAFHNGISLQVRSELCQLMGAKFTGHPDYDTLPQIPYHVVDAAHPILSGVKDFTIGDEPYMFQMDELAERTMLLEYGYEGRMLPAAWCRPYGKGRVAYFACGHNLDGFLDDTVGKIIQNAAAWATEDRK